MMRSVMNSMQKMLYIYKIYFSCDLFIESKIRFYTKAAINKKSCIDGFCASKMSSIFSLNSFDSVNDCYILARIYKELIFYRFNRICEAKRMGS